MHGGAEIEAELAVMLSNRARRRMEGYATSFLTGGTGSSTGYI